jgi:hypothetical protein
MVPEIFLVLERGDLSEKIAAYQVVRLRPVLSAAVRSRVKHRSVCTQFK